MELQIRQYQDSIIEITNAFDIPLEAKRLVLSSILSQVEQKANMAIQLEINDKEKENDGKG